MLSMLSKNFRRHFHFFFFFCQKIGFGHGMVKVNVVRTCGSIHLPVFYYSQ